MQMIKWNKFEMKLNKDTNREELCLPLPEENENILIYYAGEIFEDCFLRDGEDCYLDSGIEFIENDTHWCNFPKAPNNEINPGNIVYKFNPLRTRINEWIVDYVTFGRNDYFSFGLFRNGTVVKKNMSDIGDNVFFTREEAEQLIKKEG